MELALAISVVNQESLLRDASPVLHVQHPEALHQSESSCPSHCPEHVHILEDTLGLVCATPQVSSTRAVEVDRLNDEMAMAEALWDHATEHVERIPAICVSHHVALAGQHSGATV